MTTFTGTSGDDLFKGKGQDDVFDLFQGGNDNASGGNGDDTFNFGGALTSADKVNGGAGIDVVVLEGDYSAGLTLKAATIKAVEEIDLTGHFNYSLTTIDANVAAGQRLAIDASDLAAFNKVTFDGSQETDGAFDFAVRVAQAHLIGGAGADTFTIGDRLGSSAGSGGGSGGDVLTGGAGADTFDFLSLGKAGVRPHEITDLAADDTIDISNIDADKKTDGDQAFTLVSSFGHHAGEAVLSFDVETGKTSLQLDVNGDAKADYVVLLDGDQSGFTHFVL